MQGHSYWVILALTWLFCSELQADEETRLQCDDPNVHDAVALVLLAHNKELTEGNQLALYQITEAAKVGLVSVYSFLLKKKHSIVKYNLPRKQNKEGIKEKKDKKKTKTLQWKTIQSKNTNKN